MNQPFHPSQFSMLHVDRTDALAGIIARWKEAGARIAFVPTMGALHDGHLCLVRLARTKADKVVASIFVNPAQFAPHEDFAAYPRTLERDLALLQREGVDLTYTPDETQIYPDGRETRVKAGVQAQGLESDFRPHFFDGVVNVVYRLFNQVQPDVAVFGKKDYQQLRVIHEMVEAEKLPTEIIGAEIARDEHGLALSSRNAYLSAEELEIARMMNQIIYKAAFDVGNGAPETAALDEAKESLLTCGFDRVDYVAVRWGRVLAAAWLGRTRLIDNCAI
jgi:pantoate--beta-alanine ligase